MTNRGENYEMESPLDYKARIEVELTRLREVATANVNAILGLDETRTRQRDINTNQSNAIEDLRTSILDMQRRQMTMNETLNRLAGHTSVAAYEAPVLSVDIMQPIQDQIDALENRLDAVAKSFNNHKNNYFDDVKGSKTVSEYNYRVVLGITEDLSLRIDKIDKRTKRLKSLFPSCVISRQPSINE